MRVISQNGYYDFNYDNLSITLIGGKHNNLYAFIDPMQPIVLAEYSTKEKALKAMEQLRVAYMNCEYFSRVISGTVTMDMPKEKAIVDFRNLLQSARESYVFRFPADEDLEE